MPTANRSARYDDKLLFTFLRKVEVKRCNFANSHSRTASHEAASLMALPFSTHPFNFNQYNPSSHSLIPRDRDPPLRANSVCLSERPRSKYTRKIYSAGTKRLTDRQFYQNPPQQKPKTRPKRKVVVKQQNRKVIDKIPFALSVQNLSIPMKYADPSYSTSKTRLCNDRIDYRTKSSNPFKQVNKKRLCVTVDRKETENKLLVQISEAEQVSDFERILNSNAVQCESWHMRSGVNTSPRPHSAYSLNAVSETYYHLFKQHEESLQSLIDKYREDNTDHHKNCPSLLEDNWYENLKDLSEFYEDDQALQKEIETITNRIVDEEVINKEHETGRGKEFNVNLTGLLGLRVDGEEFSPISNNGGPSPDVDKSESEEKEWLPSMSANDDTSGDKTIECLAQNLESVVLENDGNVPSITFSNCCDGCVKNESPENSNIAIHLAVPSIESVDETRPPM